MYRMKDRNSRERLLHTTRDLLWDRGYAATSPRAILSGSKVGQGSMYHHFSGKEDLAAHALAGTAGELVLAAAEVLGAEGTAVDRLTGYLTRQRDVLRGCPVGRMAGDAEVVALPVLHTIVRDTFDRVRTMMADVIAAGVAAGELDPETDPAALADTVLAVVQGGYVLARAAGDTAPFDRAVQGAVALLLAARCESHPHMGPAHLAPRPDDEGVSR
jgi:TetR/AcrR family transcriptional regulator, transcriptional repressor for nem operon